MSTTLWLPAMLALALAGSTTNATLGDSLQLALDEGRYEFQLGDCLQITATITNRSARTATLVAPGDGSLEGRRTPVVGWSALDNFVELHPAWPEEERWSFCGNINTPRPDELVVLAPGESMELRSWIGLPTGIGRPGRYRVRLYYRNDPGLEWSGVLLGQPAEGLMEAIGRSTPCELASDEALVVVHPREDRLVGGP